MLSGVVVWLIVQMNEKHAGINQKNGLSEDKKIAYSLTYKNIMEELYLPKLTNYFLMCAFLRRTE